MIDSITPEGIIIAIGIIVAIIAVITVIAINKEMGDKHEYR